VNTGLPSVTAAVCLRHAIAAISSAVLLVQYIGDGISPRRCAGRQMLKMFHIENVFQKIM
jgi:hypothetical protein